MADAPPPSKSDYRLPFVAIDGEEIEFRKPIPATTLPYVQAAWDAMKGAINKLDEWVDMDHYYKKKYGHLAGVQLGATGQTRKVVRSKEDVSHKIADHFAGQTVTVGAVYSWLFSLGNYKDERSAAASGFKALARIDNVRCFRDGGNVSFLPKVVVKESPLEKASYDNLKAAGVSPSEVGR